MGAYKNIKETFEKEYSEKNDAYKQRLSKWRSEPPVTRVAKPTNVARARKLGYKAKEGLIVVRARVRGGRKKRVKAGGGRKPSKSGRFFSRVKSLQSIAEDRAARRFSNCEVLNSYFVGNSGTDSFYEVLLLDRENGALATDPIYGSILSQRGRAFRGRTSAGKKHRGLA